MKKQKRKSFGKYIVADPEICHGQLTYKGTRIMVWQILEAMCDGESISDIVKAWDGKVSRKAIVETIRLVVKDFVKNYGLTTARILTTKQFLRFMNTELKSSKLIRSKIVTITTWPETKGKPYFKARRKAHL